MKYIKLFIISLLINSYISELYKGIQSKCTKKNKNENIDGTLACLREGHDIYVPYFDVKIYSEAIKSVIRLKSFSKSIKLIKNL